jgi:hypothetical protein
MASFQRDNREVLDQAHDRDNDAWSSVQLRICDVELREQRQ